MARTRWCARLRRSWLPSRRRRWRWWRHREEEGVLEAGEHPFLFLHADEDCHLQILALRQLWREHVVLIVVSGKEDVVGNVADKVLCVIADDNAVVDVAGDVIAPCRRRRRWRLLVQRLTVVIEDRAIEVVVLVLVVVPVLVRALLVVVLLEGLILVAEGVVLWDPGAVLVGVAEVAGAPLHVPHPSAERVPRA
jgi:hypothetical protein